MAAVSVIATSREGTCAALRVAAELAALRKSKLWLFVRVEDAGALPQMELEGATVLTYSGRAGDLLQLVPISGPVIVGGRGGVWRPTAEQQLARKFAAFGYRVIFALSESSRSARAAVATSRQCVWASGDT